MLGLRKVAVTGGLSSGKSSVCRMLSDLGAFVVDTDAISHHLLSPETPLGQNIQRLLGSEVVVNGQFDRSKIAERVFTHPALLSELEHLLHPAIRAVVAQEYQKISQEGRYPLFVVEVPLLFESQWESDFDVVVAVVAEESKARQRYNKNKGNDTEFDRRMNRQWSPQKKAESAHYVLNNNGSEEQLRQDVTNLFSHLLPII